MALSVSQTIAGQVSNNEATDTASFGAGTSAGALIVVPVLNYNGGGAALPTILDANGNTWNTAASAGAGTTTRSLIFWSLLTSACGAIEITPNGGSTDHNCHWAAFHVLDVDASPLDQTASDNRPTNDGTLPDAFLQSSATAIANEIVFICMATRGNFVTYNITAPTTGYTDHARQNGTSGIGSSIGYKIVSSAAAQTATWTHDNDGGGGTVWSASMATFKELVAGGQPAQARFRGIPGARNGQRFGRGW